jgi:hypothetical protein
MPRPPKPRPPFRQPGHIPEQHLEAFAMGKPIKNHAEAFQSHLLACDLCRTRLDEEVAFTVAIREALREFHQK